MEMNSARKYRKVVCDLFGDPSKKGERNIRIGNQIDGSDGRIMIGGMCGHGKCIIGVPCKYKRMHSSSDDGNISIVSVAINDSGEDFQDSSSRTVSEISDECDDFPGVSSVFQWIPMIPETISRMSGHELFQRLTMNVMTSRFVDWIVHWEDATSVMTGWKNLRALQKKVGRTWTLNINTRSM